MILILDDEHFDLIHIHIHWSFIFGPCILKFLILLMVIYLFQCHDGFDLKNTNQAIYILFMFRLWAMCMDLSHTWLKTELSSLPWETWAVCISKTNWKAYSKMNVRDLIGKFGHEMRTEIRIARLGKAMVPDANYFALGEIILFLV